MLYSTIVFRLNHLYRSSESMITRFWNTVYGRRHWLWSCLDPLDLGACFTLYIKSSLMVPLTKKWRKRRCVWTQIHLSIPYIMATWLRKTLIFQTLTFLPNMPYGLKYQMSSTFTSCSLNDCKGFPTCELSLYSYDFILTMICSFFAFHVIVQ